MLNRTYCHLCDDMLAAAHAFGVHPRVVDVDADDALVAQWDESVPVLLYEDRAVCIHRFDERAVKAVLASATG